MVTKAQLPIDSIDLAEHGHAEGQRVIPRPSERRPHRVPHNDSANKFGGANSLRIEPDSVTVIDAAKAPSATVSPRTARLSSSMRVIGNLGGLTSGMSFGALALFGRADTAVGIVIAPVLALLCAQVIRRWVQPRVGEFIAAVMLAGFGARLLGAVPRLLGGADAVVYQREGVRIAGALRELNFGVATGRSVPGTGAVRYFSGIVNVLTFNSAVSTFLVFVAIAFVGQVFLVLAAQHVLSSTQLRMFSVLLMFSPTMVYWPSSVGKESLVIFGIGVFFFGVSLLYGRRWFGLVPCVFGGLAVGFIRPHVSMLLLGALLVGVFARQSGTQRKFALHVVAITVFVVGAMLAAGASARLFNFESFDGVGDVSAVLDFTEDRTTQDVSEFQAARVTSITDYPLATITVLFRPFIWEATGISAMLSALEGVALGVLSLFAAGGILARFKLITSQGQLLFAVSYVAIFIFVFSAIGNFGILSRQRAQVIPFVLLLIAVGVGADRIGRGRAVRP